jgi:hypothetical protein
MHIKEKHRHGHFEQEKMGQREVDFTFVWFLIVAACRYQSLPLTPHFLS